MKLTSPRMYRYYVYVWEVKILSSVFIYLRVTAMNQLFIYHFHFLFQFNSL